ncbi:hypothetical protein CP02DC14_1069B, partial [Chlamydia psittaci 02DC14]
ISGLRNFQHRRLRFFSFLFKVILLIPEFK